jgi:hypothetical protein
LERCPELLKVFGHHDALPHVVLETDDGNLVPDFILRSADHDLCDILELTRIVHEVRVGDWAGSWWAQVRASRAACRARARRERGAAFGEPGVDGGGGVFGQAARGDWRGDAVVMELRGRCVSRAQAVPASG